MSKSKLRDTIEVVVTNQTIITTTAGTTLTDTTLKEAIDHLNQEGKDE